MVLDTRSHDLEVRLCNIALRYAPEARLAILRILMAPQEDREELVDFIYEETGGMPMAELLMDLEADRSVALRVAEALKDSLRTVWLLPDSIVSTAPPIPAPAPPDTARRWSPEADLEAEQRRDAVSDDWPPATLSPDRAFD